MAALSYGGPSPEYTICYVPEGLSRVEEFWMKLFADVYSI